MLTAADEARRPLADAVQLLPDTRLSSRSVGLLWESYGIAATDSARVALEVRRDGEPSRLARIGIALGVPRSDPQSIVISWAEPSGLTQLRQITANVPTLERRIVLDVASLKSGRYVVQVHVASGARCETTSEPRSFTIR